MDNNESECDETLDFLANIRKKLASLGVECIQEDVREKENYSSSNIKAAGGGGKGCVGGGDASTTGRFSNFELSSSSHPPANLSPEEEVEWWRLKISLLSTPVVDSCSKETHCIIESKEESKSTHLGSKLRKAEAKDSKFSVYEEDDGDKGSK